MVQQVIPNLNKSEDWSKKQKKLREELVIHPSPFPNAEDIQAWMNLDTHEIFLSCNEIDTLECIWHEQTHKILKEFCGLKETICFDNIAKDLGHFFFPQSSREEKNYFAQNHPIGKTKLINWRK